MKGVVYTAAGAEGKVVDNLEKPVPAPDQVLVKSIWTAINPVYVSKKAKSPAHVVFSKLLQFSYFLVLPIPATPGAERHRQTTNKLPVMLSW